jgi:hypothetical protein
MREIPGDGSDEPDPSLEFPASPILKRSGPARRGYPLFFSITFNAVLSGFTLLIPI